MSSVGFTVFISLKLMIIKISLNVKKFVRFPALVISIMQMENCKLRRKNATPLHGTYSHFIYTVLWEATQVVFNLIAHNLYFHCCRDGLLHLITFAYSSGGICITGQEPRRRKMSTRKNVNATCNKHGPQQLQRRQQWRRICNW